AATGAGRGRQGTGAGGGGPLRGGHRHAGAGSAHGSRGASTVFLHSAYHMLQVGRAGAALLAFSRLLRLQPPLIAARQGRAVVLTTLGRYEEALPDLRALGQEAPGSDYLAGVYFHAQLQACDWSDYERSRQELAEGVRRGQRVDTPLSFIVHNESPREQRLCA